MPDGGTDHMTALRAALALKSEVIYFLTDADLLIDGDVDEILEEMGQAPKQGAGTGRGFQGFIDSLRRPRQSRKTRIQVIRFDRGPEADQQSPVTGWPRPPEDLTSISM